MDGMMRRVTSKWDLRGANIATIRKLINESMKELSYSIPEATFDTTMERYSNHLWWRSARESCEPLANDQSDAPREVDEPATSQKAYVLFFNAGQ